MDAVILSKLFSVMFRNGLVVVATSNQAPAALYEARSVFDRTSVVYFIQFPLRMA